MNPKLSDVSLPGLYFKGSGSKARHLKINIFCLLESYLSSKEWVLSYPSMGNLCVLIQTCRFARSMGNVSR